MKRVFIFQDFNSQKFWSIDVNGCEFTVNYGKLGSDGQTQVKTFASEAEAQKAADKLIAEKTKKGYVEKSEEDAKVKVVSKKYALSWDDDGEDEDEDEDDSDSAYSGLAAKIIKDKKLDQLTQLIVGAWSLEDGDCEDEVKALVEHKDRIQKVESLFWGDIDQDEQEISWIQQTDISPLLDVMPNLKDLKIKGTSGLSIGAKPRPNWRSLEIITGGLPSNIIDEIAKSDMPNLEKLIIYVGDENYGWDGEIDDFKPLMSKAKFPKLKHFGIVNAEHQNTVLYLLLDADILPQLEVLDLSYGAFDDEGGELILENVDKLKHLKEINIEYHYMNDDIIAKLKKLPIKINISDQQSDDYISPMITE